MSRCPNGHDSQADDYCDTCGILIGTAGAGTGAGAGVAGAASPGASTGAGVAPDVAAGDCQNCGAARVGDERFCEICGLDFHTGRMPQPPVVSAQPASPIVDPKTSTTHAAAVPVAAVSAAPAALAAPIGWVAVLHCDRDWWQHNTGAGGVADGVPYPDPEPAPRRVELRASANLIGRTSGSAVADIDCGSADTGVSRRHARLSLGAAGTWTLSDLGSTNGTFVGEASTKLVPQADTAFDPSEPIRIGAFTVLRLEPVEPD